jgi:medium-chain acyl-[acyl-carrier-protein] hydrolase
LLPKPPIVHHLPDNEFLEAIKEFGGMPEAVLAHQELLAMALPILRADIKILETYSYQEEEPLAVPLYAAGGSADEVVGRENLLAWERHTAERWEVQFFNGGHFFNRQGDVGPFFDYLRTALSGSKW